MLTTVYCLSIASGQFDHFGAPGLSYSTFEFETLTKTATTSTKRMQVQHFEGIKATAAVSHYDTTKAGFSPDLPSYLINVTNTGSITASVSVLGFVSATGSVRAAEIDAPLKELFDFERLADMTPGEWRLVQLTIPPAVLSLTDERGVETIRGGKYEIEVGVEGSAEGRVATASLEVAGDDAMIFSLPQP